MEIFSDGGARGNPGPGACAFVVVENARVLHKGSKYLGKTTNNKAEYEGVILALNWILQEPQAVTHSEIYFYVDSELIAKQIMGIYKIKNPDLKELHAKVKERISKISAKLIFKNIPRAKNKLADFLVNKTLDESQ